MCIYFFFLAVVKISVLKRINLFVGWTDVLRSDTQVYKCVCLTWSRIKMIYYTQKKKVRKRIPKDMRTKMTSVEEHFFFSQMAVWDISVCHIILLKRS